METPDQIAAFSQYSGSQSLPISILFFVWPVNELCYHCISFNFQHDIFKNKAMLYYAAAKENLLIWRKKKLSSYSSLVFALVALPWHNIHYALLLS